MNSVIAVMLLVSCTDNFSACNAADDMVQVYQSHEACESSLMAQIKRVGANSELVFGKCLVADEDFINGDLSIYWHIDQNDNFIVELANEDSDEKDISVSLNKIGRPDDNHQEENKPSA